jgi:aspartate racemase
MSWESTAEYYRLLNEQTRDRLGPYHQPVVLLHSVDFAQLVPLQQAGDRDAAGALVVDAAAGLVAAGAGVVGICANTMHLVAPAVRAALPADVDLVSVIDATADRCRANDFGSVGLLGTAYTMEHPFYADGLRAHGLEVIIPDAGDRAEVHRVVYEELVRGDVVDSSRQRYRVVVEALRGRGADAVLLACTEQAMLGLDELTEVPLVDTTEVHVDALLEAAATAPA